MSIKKVQCTGGHFYDGNRYEACPVCGAPERENSAEQAVEVRPKPQKREREENPKNSEMFNFTPRKKNNDDVMNIPDDKTWGLGDSRKKRAEAAEPPARKEDENKARNAAEPEPVKNEPENEAPPKLSQQVKEKANTIDAKTMGRYTTEENEPVVGWLVATGSNSQGLSFELNEGKNSIGRMRTNKVALDGEPSVSREKHAHIVFDAKNNVFYIQSGETDKMTYLNDSPVLMPQQLNAYDKIQLGDCELIFIPLCGDKFSWDNYIR